MSPIKASNIQLLEKLEERLIETQLYFTKEGLNLSIVTSNNVRNLKQFVVGLSVAILGIALPNFVGTLEGFARDTIMVSFVMFCIITLFGLVSLVSPTLRDFFNMPKVFEHHIEQVRALLREVQEIKLIEDNSTAGQRFSELEKKYKKLDLGTPSKAEILINRFEDTVLYAMFIVAFVLMSTGNFLTLYMNG